jgi:cytochrome bd-type quinol oxidase subunit 2
MLATAATTQSASYVLPIVVGVFTLALISVLVYAMWKVRNVEVVAERSRRIGTIGTWVVYVAIAAALTMLFTKQDSTATAIVFAFTFLLLVARGLLFVALRVLGPEQQSIFD